MTKPYKILHVESDPPDFMQVETVLSSHNILFEIVVVDNEEGYARALHAFSPEIILCHNALPGIDCFKALEILKSKQLYIPLIVITSDMTEQVASALVKHGASDYILKGRLSRLPHAVVNAAEKYRYEREGKKFVDDIFIDESRSREDSRKLANKISLVIKEARIGIWEYHFPENKLTADDVMLSQFEEDQSSFQGDYTILLNKVFVDDRKWLVEEITKNLNSHSEFNIEYRVTLTDGSQRHFRAVGAASKDNDGETVCLVGTNQDITSYKEAEKKISTSEGRLAEAQAIAKVGSWEADLLTLNVSWSVEACRIFELEDCILNTSFERLLGYIHPGDKILVDQKFNASKGGVGYNSVEHRIISERGTEKHVELSWRFAYDNKGGAAKAIGTIQDISTSKKESLLVAESEAKYRSLIESSMDGILLTVKSGEILSANKAACLIFQMTEEELCSMSRKDIVDVTDPQLEILLNERDHTGRASGELTFIRKDKTRFPGEISSVVFKNAYGEERTSMTIRDITTRKNAEQKLHATSAELQKALNDINKIMDSSLDVICAVDAAGYFRKVSAASEAVWGYKPHEMIGKPLMNFVHKEDNEKTLLTANQVMSGKAVNYFENRYERKNGTLVPIEWTARWDEKDQMRYGVARDVTEKKRLEKTLENERLRFQNIFLQAPCIMGILKGPNHVFESANAFCIEFFKQADLIGKPASEVLPEGVRENFIKNLDVVYATGVTYSAVEQEITFRSGPLGEVRPKYLNVIKQVITNLSGEIDGIIFFAIDVTEQVVSRIKNEASEKRYRQIVDTAQEGIWLLDESDLTVFVNDKLCQMLEYTREEMMGSDIYVFMSKESSLVAEKLLLKNKEAALGQIQLKYISKSKNEIWAQVSLNPIFDDQEKYAGTLAMLTDITETKKAEELLRSSEQRYRTLFEQNLAGFYQSTLDAVIINCNDAFARMLKYDSAADLINTNASELYFSPEDRASLISTILVQKKLYNYEGRLKCRDGSSLHFLENITLNINRETGKEYLDGIIIDITEKKQAELQLKESNDRFLNVSKATFDVIWEWDIASGFIHVGPRFSETFGYAIENNTANVETWFDHIHPEDLAKVKNEVFNKIDNNDTTPWTGEYRYFCRDGRMAHILDRGILLVNDSGRKIMSGAMQDITAKKELENLVHKSSTLARIGSWEIDLVKNTMYWSEVTKQIFGVEESYQPEMHSAINFFHEEAERNHFLKKLESARENCMPWDAEHKIINALGQVKWIRVLGETEMLAGNCIKIYGSVQDITERKLNELAVQEALEEKNTILESIGDAFFAVDKDWIVTYWNSRAEAILFKTKDEMVGHNLWDVFKSSIDSFSYQKYFEAVESGEVVHFEDFYTELQKWYEISAYPSPKGLSVYFKDVTDKKLAGDTIRASEDVRRLVMEAAMDAIICIDTNGSVTVWNPQAESIFGWSEHEMIGQKLSDTIIPYNLRQRHIKGMERYLATGEGPLLNKPFETTALNKQKDEFPVELSIVPIKQGEKSLFFCAFIRDISARKLAENNLRELHDNLLVQAKKLELSNEELEKYAYVTSHDLQEPLRMVTSFLQLLQGKYNNQLDDTAHRYINFAVDGAQRMKSLIFDLLEFSKIGSIEQPHAFVDMKEIISKAILFLKNAIDESGAVINVGKMPTRVQGNEVQLLQLFQNLVGNALKYRSNQPPHISILCLDEDPHWHFVVEDNGIGIESKFAEKIFIIFQRLHNKDRYQGTGIGLAICKKIVELHHGKIWLEPEIKDGSKFHFTIRK